MKEGGIKAIQANDEVVAASELKKLKAHIRELERMPGKKTMEVEISRKPSKWDAKKTDLAYPLDRAGRFRMKTICDTLEVARSNIMEQVKQEKRRPSRYNMAEDAEFARLLMAGLPMATGASWRY